MNLDRTDYCIDRALRQREDEDEAAERAFFARVATVRMRMRKETNGRIASDVTELFFETRRDDAVFALIRDAGQIDAGQSDASDEEIGMRLRELVTECVEELANDIDYMRRLA